MAEAVRDEGHANTRAPGHARPEPVAASEPANHPDSTPARSPEIAVLAGVQRAIGHDGAVKAARGLSHFGEHSLGWFAAGLVGAVADKPRRTEWLTAAVGVVGAHAASIAVKRVVRRPRPQDRLVRVLVGTPSRLSFPSSHATSTTAAAVVYSELSGRNLVPALVPPMLASRLVLGVHYPTDVLAGAVIGGAIGGLLRRHLRAKTTAPKRRHGSRGD